MKSDIIYYNLKFKKHLFGIKGLILLRGRHQETPGVNVENFFLRRQRSGLCNNTFKYGLEL